MAMLIAWQTLNAARLPNSTRFTDAFLIIAPGITVKDRLHVLQPADPNNTYALHEIVPRDMRDDLNRARIVITNYHAEPEELPGQLTGALQALYEHYAKTFRQLAREGWCNAAGIYSRMQQHGNIKACVRLDRRA